MQSAGLGAEDSQERREWQKQALGVDKKARMRQAKRNQRADAAKAGLCITCCKNRCVPGYRSCANCRSNQRERNALMSDLLREYRVKRRIHAEA